VVTLAGACGDDDDSPAVDAPAAITVTSPAFDDGATIPTRFTCDGEEVSPPLAWDGVPADAAELALLVEDPDAPGGTFVHWVVWGIDASAGGLDEGAVPGDASEGANETGESGYAGPCPPPGDPHHYGFTVLALSEPLDLDAGATADDLRQAVEDSVLAQGMLTGLYGRS
jgi:Raf kinase inhibitor-like YbhB/YbcL family protein